MGNKFVWSHGGDYTTAYMRLSTIALRGDTRSTLFVEMIVDVDLKDRIRWARERLELTQQQVADAVGVTLGGVSSWETGHSQTIKAPYLFKMAAVLRLNPEWLGTGEGDPECADPVAADLASLPPEQQKIVLDLIQPLKGRG